MLSSFISQPIRYLAGLANQAVYQNVNQARDSSSAPQIPVRSQLFSDWKMRQSAFNEDWRQRQQPSSAAKPTHGLVRVEESSNTPIERTQMAREVPAESRVPSITLQIQAISQPAPLIIAKCAESTPIVVSIGSVSAARREGSATDHTERSAEAQEEPILSNPRPLALKKKTFKLPVIAAEPAIPAVPALRSCLKTTTTSYRKNVTFTEYGGWNIHGIRAFTRDSPPNSFIDLASEEATLVANWRQSLYGRAKELGDLHDGHYAPTSSTNLFEMRWPMAEVEPTKVGSKRRPKTNDPSKTNYCSACNKAASQGSSSISYHALWKKVYCNDCQHNPMRRFQYVPALDLTGEDDHLDTCTSGHSYDEDCGYFMAAVAAREKWHRGKFPEDWKNFQS